MKTVIKAICCILALTLLLSVLTGCRKNDVPANESAPESAPESRPEEAKPESSDAESTESNDISAAKSEESANADVSAAESEDVDVSGENSAAEGSADTVTERGKGRLFVLDKGSLDRRRSIYLSDDGTYSFSPGSVYSYLEFGTWTEEGRTVTLTSMAGKTISLINTGFALIYIADGSGGFTQSDVKDGEIFYLSSSIIWDKAKYSPDYKSQSALHADEFLAKLKAHGYHVGDTVETGFHTENIESVFNITPAGIAEENADLDIFCVYPAGFCFFMYKGEIYRYDTFGGYHHFLVLWDYDGNGVKDIVSYDTYGSGITRLGVFVKDLTTMESISVYTRNILSGPGFSFDFDGENIYLDGEKLTYSDGAFRCGGLLE